MRFNIYDVSFSRYVLVGIPAVFRVMFVVEEYNCGGGFVHF